MNVGKAIYYILKNDATVDSLATIYPILVDQKSSFPAVVYSIQGIDPSDDKDGVSGIDTVTVQIECYTNKSSGIADLVNLSTACRNALDRYAWGAVSGVTLDGIQYAGIQSEGIDSEMDLFTRSERYNVRVK